MRLVDIDILIKDGWVLHKMVGTTLHEMPLNHPSIPTVEAEPVKHGKWEYDVKTAGFKCSECGKRIWSMSLEIAGINYCPNCGARMDDTAPSEEAYDDFYAKHRD